MQVRKQQLEHGTTGHRTTDWFQIGKGVCQGYILSPCLFNLYAEYIMKEIHKEHLNIIKNVGDKPITNIKPKREKLKAFPLRLGKTQRCPVLPFLFSIVLEVLAIAI